MKKFVILLLMIGMGSFTFAQTESHSGTLDDDDARRAGMIPYDDYTFTAQKGQEIIVRMESDDFDTYLVVRTPGGEEQANDDFEGERISQVEMMAMEDGNYTVWATGYAQANRGNYTLDITLGDVAEVEIVEGRLDPRDEQLPKGEYHDLHQRKINSESPFSIALTSYGFDGYLVVKSPGGQTWRNDDSGSTRFSKIGPLMPEEGEWTIYVTSATAQETGAYDLQVITYPK